MTFNLGYGTTGTILPGINIRLDLDGNGTTDPGTLTAEPGVPGYLTLWTNTPGILPASLGGQGGAYAGDQDDILATWPNAIVTVEAFALGSGVGTDGDLVSWSTPCNTYTYDYVPRVVVVPPVIDWSILATCEASPKTGTNVHIEVENVAPVLPNTTTDITYEVRFDGVPQVPTYTVAPGVKDIQNLNLAEDAGGGDVQVDLWDVTDPLNPVKLGGVLVPTDCVKTQTPPPTDTSKPTTTDGSLSMTGSNIDPFLLGKLSLGVIMFGMLGLVLAYNRRPDLFAKFGKLAKPFNLS
jgi:hypothetical protein